MRFSLSLSRALPVSSVLSTATLLLKLCSPNCSLRVSSTAQTRPSSSPPPPEFTFFFFLLTPLYYCLFLDCSLPSQLLSCWTVCSLSSVPSSVLSSVLVRSPGPESSLRNWHASLRRPSLLSLSSSSLLPFSTSAFFSFPLVLVNHFFLLPSLHSTRFFVLILFSRVQHSVNCDRPAFAPLLESSPTGDLACSTEYNP